MPTSLPSPCRRNRHGSSGFSRISLVLILALPQAAWPSGPDLLDGNLIDLTHAFDKDTVYWPTSEPFELDVVFKGENERGFHYEANNFSAAEHGGTHLDAPAHFYSDRQTTEQVPLERLIGPGAVVDVSTRCADRPDCLVRIEDLRAWENRHDTRLDETIVLLRTGWGKYWPDRDRYLGTSELGDDAVGKLRFPGLAPEAAQWLAGERDIRAVGIDTASIDYGKSRDFGAHVALARQNIPIFENVASLEQVPATGATIVALPMKIRGGSGGPLRILAVVRNDRKPASK